MQERPRAIAASLPSTHANSLSFRPNPEQAKRVEGEVEESAFYFPPFLPSPIVTVNQPRSPAPRIEIAKALAGLRTRSVSISDALKPLARNAGTNSVNTVS